MVAPFNVAVIVAVDVLVTWPVVIVKVPVVAPAAIVAVAGPVMAALLAEIAIVRPPTGAAELIVKDPVEVWLP